ncbi:hypothetical protein CERSUDRAFT_114321 [Gelatoporia subvermispora B]|uniref:Protein FAM72 n=1 Tax=Ceriporiopsis subvermispora (strain B) TaxID=914234 RepID=M2RGT5_CERS8|nr:hypothetical protein CERSUDRAFT_114321 [Gelatoporia subvermispora B]
MPARIFETPEQTSPGSQESLPPVYRQRRMSVPDHQHDVGVVSQPAPASSHPGVAIMDPTVARHTLALSNRIYAIPAAPRTVYMQNPTVPLPRNGHVLVPAYIAHAQLHPNGQLVLPQQPGTYPHFHVQMQRPPQPPPPVAHKVWILDCKSCGTFLTNRGMRAVLLLRPNVPLFSSDALPINCSASSAGISPSSSAHRSPTTPSAQNSHTTPSEFQTRIPGRTCECLTQTLCCHGCGNAVGYMIVVPCYRCTSSISANNRTTNGHRFVFYSSEISAGERHYVPGEREVLPYKPRPNPTYVDAQRGLQPTPTNLVPPPLTPPTPPSVPRTPGASALSHIDAEQADPEMPPLEPLPESPTPAAPISTVSFPVGPDSMAQPTIRLVFGESHTFDAFQPTRASPSGAGAPAPSSPPYPGSPVADTAAPSAAVHVPGPAPQEVPPELLKAGEVLYWHNLVRSGEIPAVCEDQRARGQPARADVSDDAVQPPGGKHADIVGTAGAVPRGLPFAGC